jgi:hypothetical protein
MSLYSKNEATLLIERNLKSPITFLPCIVTLVVEFGLEELEILISIKNDDVLTQIIISSHHQKVRNQFCVVFPYYYSLETNKKSEFGVVDFLSYSRYYRTQIKRSFGILKPNAVSNDRMAIDPHRLTQRSIFF